MNSALLHRRHVERFAQLLDEAEGARRRHSHSALDDELSDLVRVSHRLADVRPDITMRESARAEIRAAIIADAERNGIGRTATAADPAVGRATVGTVADPVTARRPFARRVRARGAILVGLAAGTLAISGIAAASGDAMPGDTLYALKRSQESAQLALATSPVSKGQLYLDFATKRLVEAQADAKDAKEFASLLGDMDSDSRMGAALLFRDALTNRDAHALATVNQFYATQLDQIMLLLDRYPRTDARHDSLLDSWNNLEHVHQRAIDIGAALACRTITPTAADAYGPTVKPCATTPPSSTPTPQAGVAPTSPATSAPTTSSGGNGDNGAKGSQKHIHPAHPQHGDE